LIEPPSRPRFPSQHVHLLLPSFFSFFRMPFFPLAPPTYIESHASALLFSFPILPTPPTVCFLRALFASSGCLPAPESFYQRRDVIGCFSLFFAVPFPFIVYFFCIWCSHVDLSVYPVFLFSQTPFFFSFLPPKLVPCILALFCLFLSFCLPLHPPTCAAYPYPLVYLWHPPFFVFLFCFWPAGLLTITLIELSAPSIRTVPPYCALFNLSLRTPLPSSHCAHQYLTLFTKRSIYCLSSVFVPFDLFSACCCFFRRTRRTDSSPPVPFFSSFVVLPLALLRLLRGGYISQPPPHPFPLLLGVCLLLSILIVIYLVANTPRHRRAFLSSYPAATCFQEVVSGGGLALRSMAFLPPLLRSWLLHDLIF